MNIAEKTRELDELDELILAAAYSLIDQSESKRVTGSNVWNNLGLALAPVVIPARLRRLVSLGLLQKDPANSTSRTTVYAPTEAGRLRREAHEGQKAG